MSTPPSSHLFSTEYLEQLAPLLSGSGLTAIARRAVREAARAALHEVLRRAEGNRAEVARIFKVSDTTLFGQLAECRLPRGGERESTSRARA